MVSHPPLTPELAAASQFARLEVHRRVVEQRSRIGTADGRLLWLLSNSAPLTLREIGEELRLEQSTVNRQVHAALDAGYVERAESAGRARRFTSTATGRELYRASSALTLGAYASGLEALGEHAEAFLGMLETFVSSFGEAVQPD